MIDKSKTYVTDADGHPVLIYGTDGRGTHPVDAAFFRGGEWVSEKWMESGRYSFDSPHPLDLVEVKPEYTSWVNCYRGGYCEGYSEREVADAAAAPNRIACVPVKYHEKDGL